MARHTAPLKLRSKQQPGRPRANHHDRRPFACLGKRCCKLGRISFRHYGTPRHCMLGRARHGIALEFLKSQAFGRLRYLSYGEQRFAVALLRSTAVTRAGVNPIERQQESLRLCSNYEDKAAHLKGTNTWHRYRNSDAKSVDS